MVMLAAVVLTGCPRKDEVREDDTGSGGNVNIAAADRASNGSLTRRTWVVWKTDDSDNLHLSAGHAFRIQKIGNNYKLIPLRSLKDHWLVNDAAFKVDLQVIGDDNSVLCGLIDIPGHSNEETTHVILIRVAGPFTSDNNVIVDFKKPDPDLGPEQQCSSLKVHQGRAHAEN